MTKLLTGLLAGIAIGILIAPDKGSETRRKISKKANDLSSDLKDQFNTFVDTVAQKFESAKDSVNEFTSGAKEEYKNGRTSNEWNS